MSKKIYEFRQKDDIEGGIYFIKYMAEMSGKDGRSYLNLILADETGDIESRLWTVPRNIVSQLEKGSFVKVSGKVNFYQGRLQFVLGHIDLAPEGEFNPEDYTPKSSLDPDKMMNELSNILSQIEVAPLKELAQSIIADPEIARRLKIWQAGKSIHHAYQSGLLEHTLSCVKLAHELAPGYQANRDLCVVGALMHDLCKIYELSSGVAVEYTEEGKLIGHLVKSLEIVDRFSQKIKDFPHSLKTHLKHILIAHHGEIEFGSPKAPQTLEAMLVHLIDFMDSKMHSFLTAIKNDTAPGHWTNPIRHLDRIIFKGDYAKVLESPVAKPQNEKKFQEKEIKQNLGSLLKDFKVD